MAKMLSKSNFTAFLQCRKRLWLHKFKPELEPEVSDKQQAIFDQGFEVETFAEQLFKGAVKLERDDLFAAEKKTRVLMAKNTGTIIQATVIAKAKPSDAKPLLMARSDIIKWSARAKAWDLYEVKSSTEVKPEHIPDVAFQKIVFEAAGYKINKTYLVHVNNEYVRKGPIEPKKLIKIEDITALVKEETPNVKLLIPEALKVLKEETEPRVRVVKQCGKPYECPFIDYCWKGIPDYSVYNLTGISEKKLVKLLDMGIMKIKDVPDDFPLSTNQEFQVKAEKTGEAIVDKKEVARALKDLKYPLYFLDYETLNPGVPKWDGTHPYQMVCFQYSVHVARKPQDLLLDESALEHYEYLATGKENPVIALLAQLKKDIPDDGGTVLVWNAGFEKTRNNEMAEMYPAYKRFLKSVNDRVFDLMVPFRKRHFVDPGFEGSHSIKAVLPILGGGVSYEDIEVGEGSDVGRQWYLSNFSEMPEAEVKRVRRSLLDYCGRDTYAIVRVLRTVLGELN